MPIQYVSDAGTLIIPGSYATPKVVAQPGGLATSGVILAIGEATNGPSFEEEQDLTQNAFGPDQKSDVAAKYGSGPLVDAFAGAVTASKDDGLQGAFVSFIPVKVNTSAKASAVLPKVGGGTYGAFTAKLGGKDGNLISRTVTVDTAEVAPATGSFILASPSASTTVAFSVNGGATVTSASYAAAATPTTIVADINGLSGLDATGGADRGVIEGATTRNITVALVSGYTATFTPNTAWGVAPQVGDILIVPDSTYFATANEGSYGVISVVGNVVTATKVTNAAGGALTAPTGETVNTVPTAGFKVYSPVNIFLAAGGTAQPGLGKSLEIADTATGTFSGLCFQIVNGAVVPATFNSTTASPKVITSSAEQIIKTTLSRQKDAVTETHVSGGDVILTLGYAGSAASATISAGVMTLTLTGGSSAGTYTITLADYATAGDLASYLSSIAGMVAAPGSNALAATAATKLDAGTYTFNTIKGAKTGRIKADGAAYSLQIAGASTLVDFAPATGTYPIGQPDVASVAFLSGGTRGATTNAIITAALEAAESCKANFVVPLFSQDAAADIQAGLTDAGSTYDIASINAAVQAHVLKMFQLKYRRRRQAICSYKGTFAAAKQAAGALGSSLVACTFQDAVDLNASGSLTTFQPWMTAMKAAGMQAAGRYKDITFKYINVNSISANGFRDQKISDVEGAIKAGLLTAVRDGTNYKWVEDQNTYTIDDNFVYNSLQAVYAANLVASTAEERMERAFVGQSLADVGAATAKMVLGAILDDCKDKYKLLASSDDAPRGYKNINIKLVNGNTMVVTAEIKLATSIKFIPITFAITAVSQTVTG